MKKRIFDVIASSVGLVVLSIPMAALWVATRVSMGRNPIFKQNRYGANGKTFVAYKFRSMTNECDGNGVLLPDEKRVTPFGEIMRKKGWDELPQLFNVLKGDMAAVGAIRPLLLPDVDKMDRRILDCKPGLIAATSMEGIQKGRHLSIEEQNDAALKYLNSTHSITDEFLLVARAIPTAFLGNNPQDYLGDEPRAEL